MEPVISRLGLESFESLPPHSRQCVYWEVEPATSVPDDPTGFGEPGPYESEFDKEAWISAVLLEWGACGQLATDPGTGVVVGSAFYAPPGRIPRSRHFPTSPVSADAILLSTIRTEPGYEDVATPLLDAVISDLIRRGVRAIEAFGRVRGAETGAEPGDTDLCTWSDEEIVKIASQILDHPQSDLCTQCMMDAAFLKNSGFDVVSSHPRFPRFRLELDEGLGWKAEVEGALENLVVMAAIDISGRERSFSPIGRA
ncbi:MAG: hypothetical protein QM662_02560 [Gordonia sp. (in: high G+C Gram-positive bacteria)]